MFRSGTEVIVLASTLKKGTGPRKGSLGFSGHKHMTLTYNNYDVGVAHIDVYFNRYGFEQKLRKERRDVLCVFPMIRPQGDSVRNQIGSLIKRIQSPKSTNVWHNIRDHMELSRKVPVVLAVPVTTCMTDLTTCDVRVLRAWFESIIMDHEFQSEVTHALTSRYFERSAAEVIKPKTLDIYHRARNDSITLNLFFKDMMKSKDRRINKIVDMQATRAFLGKTGMSRIMQEYGGPILMGGADSAETVFNILLTIMFNNNLNHMYEGFMASMQGYALNSGILDGIQEARDELLGLSARLCGSSSV